MTKKFLKYRLFLDYLSKNDFLNNQNRIKGKKQFKGNKRIVYNRIITILKNLTKFLPEETSNQVRMRYILNHETKNTIKCPVEGCKGTRDWSLKNSKFYVTCNKKDEMHKNYLDKIQGYLGKKAQLEKYGGWAAQTDEFKTRRVNTNIQRYGVDSYAKTQEFKNFMHLEKDSMLKKRKNTNLEKYGYEYANQNPSIKEKNIQRTKETLLQKYGVDHPIKIPGTKDKIRKQVISTNLKRFGAKAPALNPIYHKKLVEKRNLPEVKDKIEQTNLERYGVLYATQTPEVKAKIKYAWTKGDAKAKMKQTNLKKYGAFSIDGVKAKTAMQAHMKNTHLLTKEYLEENFLDENGCIKMQEMMDYFNIKETSCYNYMRELGIEINYKSGGFNPKEPGILYYLYDPEANLYKIVITNRSVEERFGKSFCSNRAIAILEQTYYENGYEALEAEKTILEEFKYARTINESWPEELGGRTEFFNGDILHKHNT
jgi:hypothetical protein